MACRCLINCGTHCTFSFVLIYTNTTKSPGITPGDKRLIPIREILRRSALTTTVRINVGYEKTNWPGPEAKTEINTNLVKMYKHLNRRDGCKNCTISKSNENQQVYSRRNRRRPLEIKHGQDFIQIHFDLIVLWYSVEHILF